MSYVYAETKLCLRGNKIMLRGHEKQTINSIRAINSITWFICTYACMYVCIYIYIYIYIYIHTHTHTSMYKYTQGYYKNLLCAGHCVRIRHLLLRIYIHTYAYTYILAHTYMHALLHIRTVQIQTFL